MIEAIGVRFKEVGKMSYFLPNDIEVKIGDLVIVETTRGVECGEVVKIGVEINQKPTDQPIKNIIRIVNDKDLEMIKSNEEKEKEASTICTQKIARLNLDMKLVNVEVTFDRNKMIFYFTSDGRVDFRDLVKELAAVFRTRIELRQIGVRDEAKMLNGIGMCGRGLCCATFLNDFQPVSIKMAKDQNLSLNPTKISGVCGRLMCCLKYEEDVYEELNKNMPNVGDIVSTPNGSGEVISAHVLLQQVKVIMKTTGNEPPAVGFYNVEEVTVTEKSRRKKYDDDGKGHKGYKGNRDSSYNKDNKERRDNRDNRENKKYDGKKEYKKPDNKKYEGKKYDKKYEGKKYGKKNDK